ncbi:hypothetical protein BGZ52_001345, partial [Haplosporangium bisporale]
DVFWIPRPHVDFISSNDANVLASFTTSVLVTATNTKAIPAGQVARRGSFKWLWKICISPRPSISGANGFLEPS